MSVCPDRRGLGPRRGQAAVFLFRPCAGKEKAEQTEKRRKVSLNLTDLKRMPEEGKETENASVIV